MSDASHGSEAHAPHAHEVYEGKPADSIPPDEPHTPGWLPIVGAALVLAGIMAFALSSPGGQAEPAPSVASAAAAAEAPPAPTPAQVAERPPPQRAMPPAGSVLRLPGLPSGLPRPMRRPPPGGEAPAPPPAAQPRPAP